jgi:MoaA/NifB/PqqE/SkfB family radical SAM enzyme
MRATRSAGTIDGMPRPGRFSDVHVPSRRRTYLTVGEGGAIHVADEVARRYGLSNGSRLCIEELDNHLLVHRPVTHLAKVYVEPTSECPLSCHTCMRRSWSEKAGRMEPGTFMRILDGLQELPAVPSVFFGGIGEPLAHPEMLQMIGRVKSLGAHAELITNGLALDEATVERLVELRLDALWVSLDGATEECYENVREASALPGIVKNLQGLRAVKYRVDTPLPSLGIAFVTMKRNQAELGKVIDLGLRLGATQFSISSVQPHTEEMRAEVLHEKSLGQSLSGLARMDLARMDSAENWGPAVTAILAECGLRYSNGRASTRLEDSCPFVENGSLSVRWDGRVSPCLPLMHSHFAYLGDRRREIREFSFGSVIERRLPEIWNDEDYVQFRQRLQEFDFPPCTRCNGCDSVDSNREDCFGSPAPTCGACAWAQGFIVCP